MLTRLPTAAFKGFSTSQLSALQPSSLLICCMCSTFSPHPTAKEPMKTTTTASKKKKKKKPSTIDFVELKESDLVESFIKGRGPGGQSINKSASRVRLTHVPSGISVAVQETRDLSSNRKIARKLVKEKLDFVLHGAQSKLGLRISKLQKKKNKSASRAAKKYDNGEISDKLAKVSDEVNEDGEEDSGSSGTGSSSESDSGSDEEGDNLK